MKCSIKLVHVLTSFEWLEIYFSIDEYSRDPSTRHPNTGLMSGAITILIPGFEVWKLGSIHVGGGLLSENWFSIQIPFKLPTIQWLDHIFCNTQLLWGSEYQTSLVFECLKVVQWPKSQFFKCNLNTGLNLLGYRQPFRYQTSEYQTSKSPLFRCFCYSDPHCISLLRSSMYRWGYCYTFHNHP